MSTVSNSLRRHARELAQIQGVSYTAALQQYQTTPTAITDAAVWQPHRAMVAGHVPALLITGATGTGKTWTLRSIAQQMQHSGTPVIHVRPWSEYGMEATNPALSFQDQLAAASTGGVIAIDGPDPQYHRDVQRLVRMCRSLRVYPVICSQHEIPLVGCSRVHLQRR